MPRVRHGTKPRMAMNTRSRTSSSCADGSGRCRGVAAGFDRDGRETATGNGNIPLFGSGALANNDGSGPTR